MMAERFFFVDFGTSFASVIRACARRGATLAFPRDRHGFDRFAQNFLCVICVLLERSQICAPVTDS